MASARSASTSGFPVGARKGPRPSLTLPLSPPGKPVAAKRHSQTISDDKHAMPPTPPDKDKAQQSSLQQQLSCHNQAQQRHLNQRLQQHQIATYKTHKQTTKQQVIAATGNSATSGLSLWSWLGSRQRPRSARAVGDRDWLLFGSASLADKRAFHRYDCLTSISDNEADSLEHSIDHEALEYRDDHQAQSSYDRRHDSSYTLDEQQHSDEDDNKLSTTTNQAHNSNTAFATTCCAPDAFAHSNRRKTRPVGHHHRTSHHLNTCCGLGAGLGGVGGDGDGVWPGSGNMRPACASGCRIGRLLVLFFLIALGLILVARLGVIISHLPGPSCVERSGELAPADAAAHVSPLSQLVDGNSSSRRDSRNADRRWIVSTSKCHIPAIDAWDDSIADYVRTSPPLNCPAILEEHNTPAAATTASAFKLYKSYSYVEDNELYFEQEAIQMGAPHNCCYRSVSRADESDDELWYGTNCSQFVGKLAARLADGAGWTPPHELIRLECMFRTFNYTIIHSFVDTDANLNKLYDNTNPYPNLNPSNNNEYGSNNQADAYDALDRMASKRLDRHKYYNVLMLGVDTLSRLNAIRQLNSTLSLLRNQYKTIEFVGYNKVGENTFPNLVPLLTGLKPEQLTETQCWLATNYTQDNDSGDDFLDNCKYMWNFYQELGYATYFSEDWPKASTFNYLKPGFLRQPTNFYGRPFSLARQPYMLPKGSSCQSCMLDKPIVGIDLENLASFLTVNQRKPHFAFHWINCPQHDDLNGASKIDSILSSFFKNILAQTYHSNTFVVFFSDHGYRWNNFVSTRVGHYESSMPLLTVAAPERFIRQHPDLYQNLLSHKSALLTPFDMFKTLIDIRNLGKYNKAQPVPSSNQAGRLSRPQRAPIGLPPIQFPTTTPYMGGEMAEPTAATTVRQEIVQNGLNYVQKFSTFSILRAHNSSQLDRSCLEAGIPDNYCVCHEFAAVDKKSSDALGAAYYLVHEYFNSHLWNHRQLCHVLELDELKDAQMFDFGQMKANGKKKDRRRRDIATQELDTSSNITQVNSDTTKQEEHNYLPNREYNIRISTKPGGALFQEVVRFYGDDVKACEREIEAMRLDLVAHDTDPQYKRSRVAIMNKICKFSVNSDSISRLNLYRDQSKCVKSNIELKKICYCNDLL